MKLKMQLGLRERKAAQLKMKLLEIFISEMNKKDYHDVNIEDVCAKAMISKVTFFKYFSSKDEILRFEFTIWSYKVIAHCLINNIEGLRAIKHTFDNLAIEINKNPTFYSNALSFLSVSNNNWYVSKLTDAEKKILFPNDDVLSLDIKISIGQFNQKHLSIARKNGEIKSNLSDEDLSLFFGALLHGSAVMGFRQNPNKPGDICIKLYQQFIQLI